MAFVYQGSLKNGGSPANGSYDFKFHLYDASVGGSLLGTETKNGVVLLDGYFDVELDFGSSPFHGDARWLEIEVKPTVEITYTPLNPRQEMNPTPYALYAPIGGGWVDDGDVVRLETSTDKVGIGTTEPADKLHLQNGHFRLQGISGPPVGYWDIYHNASATGDYGLVFKRSGVEHLTLDKARSNNTVFHVGNFGIGTTDPASPLHVKSGYATLRLQDDDDPASYTLFDDSGPGIFTIEKFTSSGTSLFDMDADPLDGISDSAIRFFRHTNTTGIKRILLARGDGTNATDAQIGVDGTDSYFQIYGGNVGIGTTTPTAKLEVEGGAIKATGGLIIETRTSDPVSPVTGQIWLRTDIP